jgi:anti-anti-sigma regulatory factor
MLENDTKLDYFVSEKSGFLVLSFLGAITKSTLVVFEKAQLDVRKSEATNIVLNFHDITKLDVSGIPGLVKLQKMIRERPAELRICFLRPDFKKMLLEGGAVRPNELNNNLLDALKSFSPVAEHQAA